MRIDEAIMQADELLRGNPISRETKVRWLSELDQTVFDEVIMTHEGFPEEPFTPYTPDTDGGTELLISSPHDRLYVEYLKMKINAELYEFARYNANLDTYTTMMDEFRKWYNRRHMPLKVRNVYWWR